MFVLHKKLFLCGLEIWLAATLALRFTGQSLLYPGSAAGRLLLLALSFPLMALLSRRLCSRFDLRRGAVSLVMPTLLLDSFSSVFFPVMYPNMSPQAAGVFGGLDAVLLCRSARGRHRGPNAFVRKRPNLLAGEDLRPAPKQERSWARRARLKTAGIALFGEKGYERTSISDIAQRAKLPIGSFYQHFHSKRQLLLVLMDELLEKLSRLHLNPTAVGDVRLGLRDVLSRAFSADLKYLGAYRAWQEAAMSDRELARKQVRIHAWTAGRVERLFQRLQRLPGARPGVEIATLARVMDSFFWNFLGQALRFRPGELARRIDSATNLIYHALFLDGS